MGVRWKKSFENGLLILEKQLMFSHKNVREEKTTTLM